MPSPNKNNIKLDFDITYFEGSNKKTDVLKNYGKNR